MVLVLLKKGKIFSTVGDAAGLTTQVLGFRPANCALRGLMPAGPKERQVSTKLLPTPAPATDVGAWVVPVFPVTSRTNSKFANQKSLSLMIGPPAVAPNCSRFAGVTCPVKKLEASVALASRPNA